MVILDLSHAIKFYCIFLLRGGYGNFIGILFLKHIYFLIIIVMLFIKAQSIYLTTLFFSMYRMSPWIPEFEHIVTS